MFDIPRIDTKKIGNEEYAKKIARNLQLLQEQLQFTLYNLSLENFETGVANKIDSSITDEKLQESIEQEETRATGVEGNLLTLIQANINDITEIKEALNTLLALHELEEI